MTLSERIAALTGPDRQIDVEISNLLWKRSPGFGDFFIDPSSCRDASPPRWTSDLNVVVAEIERRGLAAYLCGNGRRWEASVYVGEPAGSPTRFATPCRALLAALIATVESTP